MNNKFYKVCTGTIVLDTSYNSEEEAMAEAKRLANESSEKVFILESTSEVMPDINTSLDSFESACKYLDRSIFYNFDWVDKKHRRSMIAIYKLTIIAEAWNKEDGFVSDFTNFEQHKWYPWFDIAYGGVAFAGAYYVSSFSSAFCGSRLAFKSEKRVTQFGKQFIDLWNDFLLFR